MALRSRLRQRPVVERLTSGEISGLRAPPSKARMPGQEPVDGGVGGNCVVFVPEFLPVKSPSLEPSTAGRCLRLGGVGEEGLADRETADAMVSC